MGLSAAGQGWFLANTVVTTAAGTDLTPPYIARVTSVHSRRNIGRNNSQLCITWFPNTRYLLTSRTILYFMGQWLFLDVLSFFICWILCLEILIRWEELLLFLVRVDNISFLPFFHALFRFSSRYSLLLSVPCVKFFSSSLKRKIFDSGKEPKHKSWWSDWYLQ